MGRERRSVRIQENHAPAGSEGFFADCLQLLTETGRPFLVAGTFALTHHTGITRPTKDLDVFCKAGDCPRILTRFQEEGYRTEVEDEQLLSKVWNGEKNIDNI